jgi:hypothetical protein
MVIRHRRKIAALFSQLELPHTTRSDPARTKGCSHRNGNGENSPKILRAMGA